VSMHITVNGKPMDVEGGTTITGLLERLGVTPRFTAVAVNGVVTPRGEHGTWRLGAGDRVEIVRPMGGG
jgi:thiamine biosynthesis protein ThiS